VDSARKCCGEQVGRGGGLRLQMDNLHALVAADASAILPALAAGPDRERESERGRERGSERERERGRKRERECVCV